MAAEALGRVILPLLRSLSWSYGLQPPAFRRVLAKKLGGLLYRMKIRHNVVEENLRYAFPGDAPETVQKREKLVRLAYEHLGYLGLEIFQLLGPMRRFVLKRSELRGVDHWRRAHEGGKGVIFLSSHVGNWEIMAATGGLYSEMELMLVTKHLKPEWLHQAIEKGRARCRVTATYEPRTFRDVLSHLKKKRTIGFVLDQFAGAPVGVRVPVFGIPVGTSTAVATLAKRTGAPVLPVVNFRTPEGRFIVEIQAPLEWKSHEDTALELATNTANYAAVLEKHIYEHPEQWLWIHRRFKGDLSPLRPGEWSEGRARK